MFVNSKLLLIKNEGVYTKLIKTRVVNPKKMKHVKNLTTILHYHMIFLVLTCHIVDIFYVYEFTSLLFVTFFIGLCLQFNN